MCDRSVLDLLILSSGEHKPICDGAGDLRRYSLVDLSSGAIDNKKVLNLSSDSLEIFDDKEGGGNEDTCENILGDGCTAGGTTLNICGRLNSDNFETLSDASIRRVPPLELITQALRRDPILRRLEKVSIMTIFP